MLENRNVMGNFLSKYITEIITFCSNFFSSNRNEKKIIKFSFPFENYRYFEKQSHSYQVRDIFKILFRTLIGKFSWKFLKKLIRLFDLSSTTPFHKIQSSSHLFYPSFHDFDVFLWVGFLSFFI